MSLTAELMADHKGLVAAAKGFIPSIRKDPDAVVAKTLAALKTGLVAHLTREDRELYPAAVEAAKRTGDTSAVNELQAYAKTMSDITTIVLGVFAKYEAPGGLARREEMEKDWVEVIKRLRWRMLFEETGLYKTYNRLIAK